jgi:hypothetical protein
MAVTGMGTILQVENPSTPGTFEDICLVDSTIDPGKNISSWSGHVEECR